MAGATHLFDTSAILAHYFDETGAAEVNRLLRSQTCRPAISVLTIPELRTRLTEESDDRAEAERAFGLYVDELMDTITVNRAVADLAVSMRRSAKQRLPLVDAVIAACAAHKNCTLVHRDPHMAAIPEDLVRQIVLADKT